VGLDTRANVPVVVLETERQDRVLLIFIGHAEAAAIARRLDDAEQPPRPMTHDLLNTVIERLGGTLSRVVVTRIADGTFYGELVVQQGEESLRIDTRPSDAMALALRADAAIFVARQVLDEAGLPPERVPEKLPPEPQPRPEPREPVDPQRAI
jgi:bifunctional DNase/RNase